MSSFKLWKTWKECQAHKTSHDIDYTAVPIRGLDSATARQFNEAHDSRFSISHPQHEGLAISESERDT